MNNNRDNNNNNKNNFNNKDNNNDETANTLERVNYFEINHHLKNFNKKPNKQTSLLQNEKDSDKIINLILNDEYKKNHNNEKIEDRLLNYGKIKKQNDTQELFNKCNADEKYYGNYHPKTNMNSGIKNKLNQKFPKNFLDRMAQYKIIKQRNIENIKNKLNKHKHHTYRPKIVDISPGVQNIFSTLKQEEKMVKEFKQREKNKQLGIEDNNNYDEMDNNQNENQLHKNNSHSCDKGQNRIKTFDPLEMFSDQTDY